MNDITPTMTHRHITPRIAKTMLSHNTGNRPLRKAVVQRYTTDMKNGDWQDNGDPIRFDTNGRLIDGQHRLEAVILSDTPIDAWVLRGLKPETQKTMDQAAPRSLADWLKFKGEANVSRLATLTMLDARWNTLGPTYAFGEGRRKMTRSQFARFFDEHADELRDALPRGRKYARRSGNLLSDNVCALLWLEFSKISRSDADIFFVRFSEGSNLGEGDPILVLRRALIRAKTLKEEGLQSSTRFKVALTIKAWNKYRQGLPARSLSWKPGGAAKEPFPLPY